MRATFEGRQVYWSGTQWRFITSGDVLTTAQAMNIEQRDPVEILQDKVFELEQAVERLAIASEQLPKR